MDTWCYVCLDECLLRVFLQNTTKVQHLNWQNDQCLHLSREEKPDLRSEWRQLGSLGCMVRNHLFAKPRATRLEP